MLRITGTQEAGLRDRELLRDLSRIHDYLLRTAPERMARLAEHEQVDFVRRTCAEGQDLGIVTRAGLGRWCYLQLVSGGRTLDAPAARDLLDPRLGGLSPDEAVSVLMQQTARALKAGG